MLNNKQFSRWLTYFTLAASLALALPAQANTWPLPPPGSRLVGKIPYTLSKITAVHWKPLRKSTMWVF